MTRTASRYGGTLSQWLEAEGLGPGDASDLGDVARIRTLLIAAARERRAVSYAELLASLGHRFTRPKMRAVCRTLDAIDRGGDTVGEPPLAVLVVRESDGLPGQGWWIGREGIVSGSPAARGYVEAQQCLAFDYWSVRA